MSSCLIKVSMLFCIDILSFNNAVFNVSSCPLFALLRVIDCFNNLYSFCLSSISFFKLIFSSIISTFVRSSAFSNLFLFLAIKLYFNEISLRISFNVYSFESLFISIIILEILSSLLFIPDL
ncbi:MAG: hypothetical protein BWY27_01505 [Bacteroidetes bacterium ADurb.Bin234]|nr:MAG: hypothetical protein BWY27_01505 [Bacteroidetes bacterium ADurb.Bin234]